MDDDSRVDVNDDDVRYDGETFDFRWRCWCGEAGWYSELCDEDGLEPTCGGTGERHCFCGGDLCVCHHHGSDPCDGCADCDPDGEGDYDDDPGEG